MISSAVVGDGPHFERTHGRFASTRTARGGVAFVWSTFLILFICYANLQDSPMAEDLSVSLCVCASVCVSIDRTGYILVKITSVEMTFVDVIAKIALSDLDLLFEGQKVKKFIYFIR